MAPVFFFLAFLIGVNVGSFLNVVIIRGGRNESLGGRSYCDHCKKPLGFTELIPIASFIIQKGRCRGCGNALSWQYPIIEFCAGILYGIAALVLLQSSLIAITLSSLVLFILAGIGIAAALVIAAVDIRNRVIPDIPLWILTALGIIATGWRAYSGGGSLIERVEFDVGGAFFAAAILWILWKISDGRWMGFGDVKLIFATSLIIGFPASIVAFLFAFWLGALWALALLMLKRAEWRSVMPFGPFIIAGAGLAYLCSPWLIAITGPIL